MIKAVVFDMDGVLIDTEKHYYEAWQEAARSFGYDFRSEHALMLRSCDANVAAKMMKGNDLKNMVSKKSPVLMRFLII